MFQIDTAIILALRNIKKMREIVLEGKREDIELYFEDGGVLYCQAKAHQNARDAGKDWNKRLAEALKTLSEACEEDDCACLVYATNDPLPFGKRNTGALHNKVSFLGYENELTQAEQDCIARHIGANDRFEEKFQVLVFPYYGEDGYTRLAALYDFVRVYFQKHLGSLRLNVYELREDWYRLLSYSASVSQRKNALGLPLTGKTVSKKAFIWPIVVKACGPISVNADDYGLEEDQYQEVRRRYERLITANSERFDMVTRVVSDYLEFSARYPGKPNEKMSAFCLERGDDYVGVLGADAITETDEKAVFVRLVLTTIIKRRDTIGVIKRAVNLHD